METTTLFPIIISVIIINLLIIIYIISRLDKINDIIKVDQNTIKSINEMIDKNKIMNEFNSDFMAIIIKHAYNNGTPEEQNNIERLFKKYKNVVNCNIEYTS